MIEPTSRRPGPSSGRHLTVQRLGVTDASPRHRFALFLKILLGIIAGLQLLGSVARMLIEPSWAAIAGADTLPGWIVIGVLAGTLLGVTRRQPSHRALVALDLLVVAVASGVSLAFLPMKAQLLRPELNVLIGMIVILVVRAAVVPSSVQRTLAVGLLAFAPITLLAPRIYSPADLVAGVSLQTIAYITLALWSAAAVAATTATSGVIYGLRRTVDQAQRFGQYKLLRKLGEGGMGTVYEASHALLKRPTAVKVVVPDAHTTDESLSRFAREAQITSDLNHPNIVNLYDYGRTDDGTLYYAMEFIVGLTLDELVEREGALPPARALNLLRQACAALAEAHSHGLIHRDIKPANIMVCQRPGAPDLVKVLDFGLAKDVRMDADGNLTQPGAIMGTPYYMAPEAFMDPGGVGPATDVYALGAVGYFLLTGAPMFESATYLAIADGHLRAPVVPPSLRSTYDVPRRLEAALLRALSKEAGERFRDGGELFSELRACERESEWTSSDAKTWWRERGEALVSVRPEARRRSDAEADTVVPQTAPSRWPE